MRKPVPKITPCKSDKEILADIHRQWARNNYQGQFSQSWESEINDFDGRRAMSEFIGDKGQRKIDLVPDDGGQASAYKRMLQRQHDNGRKEKQK